VRNNALVVLLHVIDHDIQQCVTDYCIDSLDLETLERQQETTAQRKLQELQDRWLKPAGVRTEYVVLRGSVNKEILKLQQSGHFDLIVLGSHGQSGALKHILGGVTDRVVRTAGSSVLIAKDPRVAEARG
jgi:nucleotide-binding universal stress UspA family protein